MAKRVLHGPSAYGVGPDGSGKLPSPELGLTFPTSSYVEPSEATDLASGFPALRQDVSLSQPSDEPLSITGSLGDFLSSTSSVDDFYLLLSDSLEATLDTDVDQFWDCNLDLRSEEISGPAPLATSPIEIPRRVTDAEALERTDHSAESVEFVHKRRKVAHKDVTAPIPGQQASQKHGSNARGLGSDKPPPASWLQQAEPPGLTATTPAMTEQVQKSKRSLPCPFREAQSKFGLPYTCTAAPVATVSAVRTHLIRQLPEARPPHLPFLKLCRTCNDDILDKIEFETLHGKDGLKCDKPRQQRKGNAGQQEQYDILCSKVEAYIVAQRSQTALCTGHAFQSLVASQGEAAAALRQPSTPTSSKRTKDLPSTHQNAEQGSDLIAESHSPSLTETGGRGIVLPIRSTSNGDIRTEALAEESVASTSQPLQDDPGRAQHTSTDQPTLRLHCKDTRKAEASNYIRLTPYPATVGQSRNPYHDFMQDKSTTSTQNATQALRQHELRRPQSSNLPSPEVLPDVATASRPYVETAIDIETPTTSKVWGFAVNESRRSSFHDSIGSWGHGYVRMTTTQQEIPSGGIIREDSEPSFEEETSSDYLWPPSIYEAANSTYLDGSSYGITSKAIPSTHAPLTHGFSLPNRMSSLQILPRDTSARDKLVTEDLLGICAYRSSLYPSYSRSFSLTVPPADISLDGLFESDRGERSAGLVNKEEEPAREQPGHSQSQDERVPFGCSICVDKPRFTGQYAQRNLNRHMENHHSTAKLARSGRHIRCGQPGCTSTFGREDALLVHLRRSHPELSMPPRKRRKRLD